PKFTELLRYVGILRGEVAKLPVPTTVLAEDADIAKKLGELRGRYPDALGEVGHLNRVTGEPAVVDGHLRASLFQLSGLVLDLPLLLRRQFQGVSEGLGHD